MAAPKTVKYTGPKTFGDSARAAWDGLVRVFKPDHLGHVSKAKNVKVGFVEKTASAPLRFVANHPRMAIAGAVAAGAAWWMGHESDKKKQAELDAYSQQSAGMPSYRNTVSPDEWAATQSQFRTNDQQGGFADRLSAERAAAAAAQQQQGA